MTQEYVHTFDDGMKSDLDNHLKTKNSFIFGENCRLSAKDGTLSLVSVKGTQQILSNPNVNKYLGAASFKDELIVFCKCSGVNVNLGGVIFTSENVSVPYIQNFEVELVSGTLTLTDEISTNSSVVTYTENVSSPAPPPETELEDNYSPENSVSDEIDFSTYYSTNVNVPIFAACPVTENTIPVNNANFADCIISITIDSNGNYVAKELWAGYQNWPINGKIVALGVDENANYRRIKYTDYVNPFRSINTKDPNLRFRSAQELENFRDSALLEPRIKEVNINGQLRSMAVQYYYRLITENGQITNFSPGSKIHYIYPDRTIGFNGGAPEEVTNKSVRVLCNVLNPESFAEIECIAVEYEANNLPTAIVTLGTKQVNAVVEFDHFGNESALGTDVNISDITTVINNWRYCSDLETKNNKLFAIGLRNDPLTNQYNELRNNFALHGWEANGNTHSSFLNPDPILYRKIPAEFTDKMFYSKKRTYGQIRVFGNSNVTFKNIETDESYSLGLVNPGDIYTDFTEDIADWLVDLETNDGDWNTFFPNLDVEKINGVILLKPVDELIETDMSNYVLEFDIEQALFETNDENVFGITGYDSEEFVDGAMSAGFNSGTGVRLTYQIEEDEILTQATSSYSGSGPILDMATPSLKKSFFKDEIYRLAIQLYRNGERIFAIPLGDIYIPKIGETYQYLDESGNIVITTDQYTNQKVVGNKLYARRVVLKMEFRMDCRFSKEFDMYQLLYVERDENNRRILCQGVSAPLMRVQDPVDFLSGFEVDERLQRTWQLPYHGGPVYDKQAFDQYDANSEDYDNPTYDELERTIASRKLFYFDAPDIIYGGISDNLIDSSSISLLGRVNTDHGNDTIMISGENFGGMAQESYPKFSRKILRAQLNTTNQINDWPKLVGDEGLSDETIGSHFMNVSVFSSFTPFLANYNIEGAIALSPGEVVPGTELNTSFELSNNAFVLPSMPWWFSSRVRRMSRINDQYTFEAYPRGAQISFGQRTVFMKSSNDLFTNAFIGPIKTGNIDSQIRDGESPYQVYDGHAIINLLRSNESSIYGGRDEQAFSQNSFIALSETKPILKDNNGAQVFNIEGDTYVTLWPRTKNVKGDQPEDRIDRDLNNGRSGVNQNRGDLEAVWKLNNAWAYAVVIETMFEPKLNHGYNFYNETTAIDMSIANEETLNSAYQQINNARRYKPRPFRFRDDPNLDNIVAASEVKLSGEFYDAWASFPANEFQELDKNQGAALNIAKIQDELYAIQERQISLLYVDRNVMIPDNAGNTINVKQGSGTSIDGYKVIAPYGTTIRRSLVKHLKFGILFVDDTKKVLVKNFEELTLINQYHHEFYNKLDNEGIVDINGFFDEEHKESCLNIVTSTGNSMIIYNEALQLLSGWRQMNASIYMQFNDKILIPKETTAIVNEIVTPNSQSLHELNKGLYLDVLDNNLKMKVSFICSPNANETFLHPHIAWVMNDLQDFESITLTTKEGLVRQLLPTHNRYKKREGKHTIPTLNYFNTGDDADEKKDIRSEWVLYEFVFPYSDGTLRKLNRVVNYIRLSYQ